MYASFPTVNEECYKHHRRFSRDKRSAVISFSTPIITTRRGYIILTRKPNNNQGCGQLKGQLLQRKRASHVHNAYGPEAIYIPLSHFTTVGRTNAVVSVADYGPRGPSFETWPRHSLLWP